MQENKINERFLLIGLLICGILGLLIANLTDNYMFGIAVGMIVAVIMQRLMK